MVFVGGKLCGRCAAEWGQLLKPKPATDNIFETAVAFEGGAIFVAVPVFDTGGDFRRRHLPEHAGDTLLRFRQENDAGERRAEAPVAGSSLRGKKATRRNSICRTWQKGFPHFKPGAGRALLAYLKLAKDDRVPICLLYTS